MFRGVGGAEGRGRGWEGGLLPRQEGGAHRPQRSAAQAPHRTAPRKPWCLGSVDAKRVGRNELQLLT